MPMISRLTGVQRTILGEVAPLLATRIPPTIDVLRLKTFEWARPAPPTGPLTATARFASRVALGDAGRLRPGIGVVATPRFTQPLGAWLEPQFLLAGVDIPPDTAGLLAVNMEFICAAEMAYTRCIAAAIERLSVDADISVKQLAADLGYASVPAFSHAFRQVTGKTPTAFAEKE